MTKYTAGRGLGILLIVAGSAHFLSPAGFDELIPPALPFEPRFWTYLSGAAELTIGAMLFVPMSKTLFGRSVRRLAVLFAFALFILVFPANIYMAVEWFDRDMPDPLIALARLPLQFGLFYWCWALNKDMKKHEALTV